VEQRIGEAAYLLRLPATWKGIYPVINEGCIYGTNIFFTKTTSTTTGGDSQGTGII
jgi:hypothetical protein